MPAKPRRQRAADGRLKKDTQARERAFEAISQMRGKSLSLKRAARAAHTTPETVKKYASSAILRASNGRYSAKPTDQLTRRVFFLTPKGSIELSVRGSRNVERIARHMAAVDRYLRTGDAGPLKKFKGQTVRSRDKKFPFLTDTDAIDRLANAGEVSFERLYTRRA